MSKLQKILPGPLASDGAQNPSCPARPVPEVSVILPVFKNWASLRELHERLCRVMEDAGHTFELVFVDDACPEGSLSVLKDLARMDPRVSILSMKKNIGQQQAVMVGLGAARGEKVVVMDADLQDPPEAIPRLLDRLREGWAAVFAGRRGNYESGMRLFTSRLFKRLLHWLCSVPPDAGIFVAMNRSLLRKLLAFHDPCPFVVAMIGCTGLPTVSIPVERSRRPDGRSAYSSWKRLKVGVLALFRVPLWKWKIRRTSQEVPPLQ